MLPSTLRGERGVVSIEPRNFYEKMKFIDEVTITVSAGKGGSGCVSFRREKYVPRGGPDGGDGGEGGSVVFEASERKHSLLDFRYRNIFKAESGRGGSGQNKKGRGGEDLIVEVPVGTVFKDPVTGEIFADLTEAGQRSIAAKGGRGGKGNAHFVSSTHRTPRFAQEGEPGEERALKLELKLIADVGLVGLPNAGKSTLISRSRGAAQNSRLSLHDPYTQPGCGAVRRCAPFRYSRRAGADRGRPSGRRPWCAVFETHRENETPGARDRRLAGAFENPLAPFQQIEHELESYSEDMRKKPRIVVLNKTDLLEDPQLLGKIKKVYLELGPPVLLVSALEEKACANWSGFLPKNSPKWTSKSER